MIESILSQIDLNTVVNAVVGGYLAVGIRQTIKLLAERVTKLELRDEEKERRLTLVEGKKAA